MKTKYNLTNEQLDFLIKNSLNKTNKELAQLLTNEFGIEYTWDSVDYLKKKYKINSFKNQDKYNLSEEEIQYLQKIVKGKTCKELCELFNTKFDKNVTEIEMQYIKRKNRITSDIKSTFKKNNIPHNLKKELSEYDDGHGGIKIKVGNKWIPKGKYIYEQHYGKIKENQVVVFLDNNKQNFDIENLMAVNLLDAQVCGIKHMKYNNAELSKIGLLTAQIINKTNERKKENE